MYKTLFEVKVLHDYYLTDKFGQSVLDGTDIETGQEARIEVLEKKFDAGIPSTTDDFLFSFPSFYKSIYQKLDLRITSTYSGFKVVVPVKMFTQTDEVVWYKPLKSIPADLPIVIEISQKRPFIDAVTNGRLVNNFSAIYYFTNSDPNSQKRLPVLSEPVPIESYDRLYEQGELFKSGNSLFAVYFDSKGNKQQQAITGTGFANESDRLTVLPRFNYFFRDFDGITSYNFVLKDFSGRILQTVNSTANNPVKKVLLDFTKSISSTITDNLRPHQLEVEANDNYNRTHTINFCDSDKADNGISWGLITIYQQGDPTVFNLFDTSGFLKTKTYRGAKIEGAPIFEIWLKSRFLFWRYFNNKGKHLKKKEDLLSFLDFNESRGIYLSKTLRNATYVPTVFQSGTTTRFFPNPSSYELFAKQELRIFADILVPNSTVFEHE